MSLKRLKEAQERLAADRGLGDTLARAIHASGLDRFAPGGCGCQRRQETLNRLIPYRVNKEPSEP